MPQNDPTPPNPTSNSSASETRLLQTLNDENRRLSLEKKELEAENEQLQRSLQQASGSLDSLMQRLGSLEQTNASLSHALAENGMSQISEYQWVDLRRCACVLYQPGGFLIQSPLDDAKLTQVTLSWQPGCLRLQESYRTSETEAVALTLPGIREPRHWTIENFSPDPVKLQAPLVPVSAAQTTGALQRPSNTAAETPLPEQMPHLELEACCQPLISVAEQARACSAEQAASDEATLAVAAMQEIQTRRLKPKDNPDQTITEVLEPLAAKLWAQALLDPREQTVY